MSSIRVQNIKKYSLGLVYNWLKPGGETCLAFLFVTPGVRGRGTRKKNTQLQFS